MPNDENIHWWVHWLLRFDPLLFSLFPPDEEDVPPPEADDDVDFKDVRFL